MVHFTLQSVNGPGQVIKTCLKIDFALLNLSTRDLSYLDKWEVNR